jgi:hypothetical protein
MMDKTVYEARKCTCSEQAQLLPIERKLERYNSVICYECDSCAKKVEITPLGSIGVLITVATLAIGIIAYLQLSGVGQPDFIDYMIVLFCIICIAGVTVPQLLKHNRYPLMPSKDAIGLPLEENSSRHILAKPISFIEGFGFLLGLIAPIIFIACFLGLAALIGYINFTYFQ